MFPSKNILKSKDRKWKEGSGLGECFMTHAIFFYNLNIPKWIYIFGVHGVLWMFWNLGFKLQIMNFIQIELSKNIWEGYEI
jgi:hypothetical protein